jgi:hypothetical protein
VAITKREEANVQQELYALALLAIALAFFLYNVRIMDEVAQYAADVKRKLYRLAMEYEFVRNLNDYVRNQAQEQNIPTSQAPITPSYLNLGSAEAE